MSAPLWAYRRLRAMARLDRAMGLHASADQLTLLADRLAIAYALRSA